MRHVSCSISMPASLPSECPARPYPALGRSRSMSGRSATVQRPPGITEPGLPSQRLRPASRGGDPTVLQAFCSPAPPDPSDSRFLPARASLAACCTARSLAAATQLLRCAAAAASRRSAAPCTRRARSSAASTLVGRRLAVAMRRATACMSADNCEQATQLASHRRPVEGSTPSQATHARRWRSAPRTALTLPWNQPSPSDPSAAALAAAGVTTSVEIL